MKNVQMEVVNEGKQLVITVDLTQNFGKSSSGKTTIIASTEGSATLEDGTMVGLNVFRK